MLLEKETMNFWKDGLRRNGVLGRFEITSRITIVHEGLPIKGSAVDEVTRSSVNSGVEVFKKRLLDSRQVVSLVCHFRRDV